MSMAVDTAAMAKTRLINRARKFAVKSISVNEGAEVRLIVALMMGWFLRKLMESFVRIVKSYVIFGVITTK
jgi:hypothetical protein